MQVIRFRYILINVIEFWLPSINPMLYFLKAAEKHTSINAGELYQTK